MSCTEKDLLDERKKQEMLRNIMYVGSANIADHIEDLRKRNKLEDKQVGGSHYQVAAIQPWDIMAAYGLDPWSANVVKYILRFPYKAGRQDLEKAQHYIEYLITHYDDVTDKYYG